MTATNRAAADAGSNGFFLDNTGFCSILLLSKEKGETCSPPLK